MSSPRLRFDLPFERVPRIAWSLPSIQDDFSRRSFLRTCSVAGAMVAAGEMGPGPAASPRGRMGARARRAGPLSSFVLRAITWERRPIGGLSPLDLEDEHERGGLAWFPRR